MKFSFEHIYEIDADQLMACRMNPEWVKAAALVQSEGEAEVSIEEQDGKKRFTVQITENYKLPVKIPGVPKGPRRNIKQEEIDPQAKTIRWSLEYPDAPFGVHVSGLSRISSKDGRARLAVDCELKIDAPLVGKVLERFFKSRVITSMERTAEFTSGWAKENL